MDKKIKRQSSGVMTLRPIARIRSDFPEKFGIPRQSGMVPALRASVVFEPEYRHPDALRGLDGFSHLWLVWQFSQVPESDVFRPTVRPPRLGGNRRMGVFATRSPNRPNRLGLSCVELLGIVETPDNGIILSVGGADLLDGTPIYDIKPYLPLADCRPDARAGFAGEFTDYSLTLDFPAPLLSLIPEEQRDGLCGALRLDPRPSYQEDGREYGLSYAGYGVHFTVRDGVLTVTDVKINN